MFNINRKILSNMLFTDNTRLKNSKLKIKKIFNWYIFKWEKSANVSYM